MKFLLLLTMFFSLNASAQGLTKHESEDLSLLRDLISIEHVRSTTALISALDNLSEYNELSFYDFKERKRLKKRNCEVINSFFTERISSAFFQIARTYQALSKVPLSVENGMDVKSNYAVFFDNAQSGVRSCKNIKRSIQKLTTAQDHLKIVLKMLNEVLDRK